jgi:hypothetical protein
MFGDAIHKDFSSSQFATFISFISTTKALSSIKTSFQRDIENNEFVSEYISV